MIGVENIREKFVKVSKIILEFSLESLYSQVKACEKLFKEDFVNIAVIGKFKSGKSSFLNYIIRAEILPVGVLPVTGVITYISSGEDNLAEVFFKNGNCKKIKFNEIATYISEELNPENKLEVSYVEIKIPELPFKNLRFVDTPGIDSIFKHNTQLSMDWLPNAGLAIVAINSDFPLSESDLFLIEKTFLYCPEILILLTKTDRLLNKDIEKTIKFISDRIKEKLNRQIKILPFSIKRENKEVIGFIQSFADNFDSHFAKISSYKVRSLSEQCLKYLTVAKTAAMKSVKEREELKKLVCKQKQDFENLKNNFGFIVKGICEKNTEKIINLIVRHCDGVEKRLKTEIERKVFSKNLNLMGIVKSYEDTVKRSLKEILVEIFNIEKTTLKNFAIEPVLSLAKDTDNFLIKLSDEARKILGVEIPVIKIELKEISINFPDVKISQSFDSHLELLWFLIPVKFFKKNLVKHFSRRISFEAEKNLTRLAMAISEEVNFEIKKAAHLFLKHVCDCQETIQKSLLAVPEDLDKIENALLEIKN